MKKHSLILTLAACLLALTALVACTDGNDENPTVTDGETTAAETDGTTAETEPDETDPEETEEVTEPETTADDTTVAETEPEETETRAPRYDYFSADVAADVDIDSSVYTDMQLTLPSSLVITDEDVQDYINYIIFDYRTADNGSTQMTDQPMKLGDDAFIYYKGVIDGEEFSGGSNWDDTSPYQLGLGSGAFIPGFEEALVGVIPANATKDNPAEIHVTFPDSYTASLAGKEATFYVAVEYAIQYTLPTYDRDFVENTLLYEGEKDFYASDKAFLTEFEAYIRAYLESDLEEDIEYAKIDALWTYLTETATCQNLPQLELDYYFNAYVDEIEYYYEYYSMYGGSSFTDAYPAFEDFARVYVGVEADGDWEAALNEVCVSMVCKDMIAHAIAELEGMEVVTDEEYQAELDYWVDYYYGYMTAEEIEANMGADNVRESAFAEKMQNWLLEHATFTFETATEA